MNLLIAITFFYSLHTFGKQNRSDFSGFYDPKTLVNLPLKDAGNSVFKIVILKEAGMFGTAYALQEDVLLTNVHNITKCLTDYGLFDSGYDGSKGPLPCKSLSLIDGIGNELNSVELLGSNSRHHNDDRDFAVIKVKGLKANPILLNPNGPQIGSPVFVVGFPSETFRSPSKLNKKLDILGNAISIVFEIEKKIKDLNQSSTSQDLYTIWIADGFKKLQPLVKWNEFLSGSVLGREWNPFIKWQSEDAVVYRKNLLEHIKHLKTDVYGFIQMIEKSQLRNGKHELDADGSLKVSKGKINSISGNTVLIEGDATPGSSGSAVVDSSGSSVGILFQIRRGCENENDICLLDAFMTDFESIRFSYCPSLGPAVVSSKIIYKTLESWGVKLLDNVRKRASPQGNIQKWTSG